MYGEEKNELEFAVICELWSQAKRSGNPSKELQGITCHMASHRVTCCPTQVNVPQSNLDSKLVLDLLTPKRWEAELTNPAMHRPGTKLMISRSLVQCPNHQATKLGASVDCCCVL